MIMRVSFLLLVVAVQQVAAQSPEERTARYMESIRDHPGLLYAFLREMPKGGDLHSHLSGAIYAESFIAWAAEDSACISVNNLVAVAAPCGNGVDTVKAATLFRNQTLYDRVVDAWSMRNWHPENESGHDRFFSTFGKFSAAGRGRNADMLVEAMRRAHDGRVSYLELMNTPNDGAAAMGDRAGWDDDLPRMREKLRTNGLSDVVNRGRADIAATFARQRQIMKCGTAAADAACAVEVRMLYQVSRGRAPQLVYAQLLSAFEIASADSMVVGFNMVQPEDGYLSMRDFSLQMRIIGYLRTLYPNVKFTLHAGELAPGLVPPEGLRNHIRESVEVAGASRIGHGVDVLYEDRPHQLLEAMAARGIAVEIALTSNDVILGIRGKEHPLRAYQQAGVPTLLATDDEGVARSEMTREYVKAVIEQGLSYAVLKQMALNSLRYAFVQDAVKARLIERWQRDVAAFESQRR